MRPPIIAPKESAATWEAVIAAFGIDACGHAVARPSKGSWLAFYKKQYPKEEAIAYTHAWLIRLLWLRRIELWLLRTHDGEACYEFLDKDHIQQFRDIADLLNYGNTAVQDRPDTFVNRFPLLPQFPLPAWFSQPPELPLPIDRVCAALRKLTLEDLERFGRQSETPRSTLATTATQSWSQHWPGNPKHAQFEAQDGKLLAAHLSNIINNKIPNKSYHVTAGPGGYRRILPSNQSVWKAAHTACIQHSKRLFAVCPDSAAADRCLYHLALSATASMHIIPCEKQFSLAPLPSFHHNIRVGDSLNCKLDLNITMKNLLPDQVRRLAMWRTALRRFHKEEDDGKKEETRTILEDLPRHFKGPLRPEGSAYRRLQKLLQRRQQQTSSLFLDTASSSDVLNTAISDARQALEESNRQAFEWRYAFPELLDPQDGAFTGFDSVSIHLSETQLTEEPLQLLRHLQVAFRLLNPGGIIHAWLPDDFLRHPRYSSIRTWLQQAGSTLQSDYAEGEHFDAMITGKLMLCWRKKGSTR